MYVFIKKNFSVFVILFITLLFFYKFFLYGLIPFPGDLLVGNYEPYKSAIYGVPHKGQGADVVRELYPWKYFTIQEIARGSFPLWNPYTFSGNPHFANLQSGALYPINFIFFVMPFIPAWGIYIVLQYIGMMLFMYVYLREIKLGKIPSIFGSLSFAFSNFMIVWGWYGNLGHALMFLPLILFSIEKLYQRIEIRYFLLLTFSFVLSIFAGYIQFTIYIYMLTFLYTIFRFFSIGREKNIKTFFLILLSFFLSIILSSIQLIPLFEILKESLRSTYSYDVLLERLMPIEAIITLLIPDFFGNPATMNYFLRGGSSLERASSIGVWPLIFAVFAFFTKRTFFKIFFLAFTVLSFISTFSIPLIAAFHSMGIPFLSTGIPTRILSVFCFCLSVLAAIGMDSYIRNIALKKKIIKLIIFFTIVFILLFTITFYLNNSNFEISRRNMIIPFGIFIAGSLIVFLKIPKKIMATGLIIFTVFELFYSFQKFNSFSPSAYIYPETEIVKEIQKIQGIDRYWGYGSANIDANFQLIDTTYTTAGYDALYIRRYGEFIASSKDGNLPSEVPRSVADITPGYGSSELKENPYRQRALDLTGVKYILNKKDDRGVDSAFDESIYSLIYEKDGWQIYENMQVLPRIASFGRYQVISKNEKSIRKLYAKDFDYKSILILEKEVPDGYSIKFDPKAKISNILYRPNSISFALESDQDQLAFLSDNYFPGWQAYVDGEKVDILRANYTYRAIPIKSGKHDVRLIYDPSVFKLGVVISGIGYMCLIIVLIIVKIKGVNGKKI